MRLFSFISYFSYFVNDEALQCALCSFKDERNEFNEKSPCNELPVISLNSSNSFFSLFVNIKDHSGTVAKNHALCSLFSPCFCLPCFGAISESQHTRCTHRVLRELAGGVAPSTPKNTGRQKP